jgi:hypothetical protein
MSRNTIFLWIYHRHKRLDLMHLYAFDKEFCEKLSVETESSFCCIVCRRNWNTILLCIYRVIHKSVKHFKNSQQINYTSNHGNSYADRE